ncbi:MAG: hypothetical protein V4500_07615 [Pseudomonadota bacterium]
MTEPITESGALDVGISVVGSDAVHTTFTLRPARLADTYRATACVAVPDDIATSAPARVAYQMAIDDAITLYQLVTLGDLAEIPPPRLLTELLDPDDMGILRAAADRLKKKSKALKSALLPSASPSASSSVQASA